MVVLYVPQVEDYSETIFTNIEYTHIEPDTKENKTTPKTSVIPQKKKAKSKKRAESHTNKKEAKAENSLFVFDPNNISVDSLKLLGFGNYAANNIDKYRLKGGRFYNASDLQKIYGLDSLKYHKIQPYINIKTPRISEKRMENKKLPIIFDKPGLALNSIDINLADTTEFKKLKGIGSVYANRIIKFRNSLGGYFSIGQISDVWGISDSLFTAIKPYLFIDSTHLKKKNINSLSKGLLIKHPYIDWNKARIIASYKKMHGDYKSMDDFRKMHGISEAFVDTLTHYFVAE